MAKKSYSKRLKDFSAYVVENMEERKHLTDQDLFNAVTIFHDVFSSKMFDYVKENKMTKTQAKVQALQAGQQLRQLLLIYTGIDMAKVAKQK